MKLTDEQREELDAWVNYNMLIGDELSLEQIRDIQSLLSSEQAWKAEAERLDRERKEIDERRWDYVTKSMELESKLNQAIEVLNRVNSACKEHEDAKYMLIGTVRLIQKVVGNYLSSLSQEGETRTEDEP